MFWVSEFLGFLQFAPCEVLTQGTDEKPSDSNGLLEGVLGSKITCFKQKL